ncbi:unnamed protein product [Phytophthora fragariaefolia]|uniref:Unnamed protein product n=1 Tax=Phytophthora fragariaefolia TaxID=1490495 RepID=A0A9W6TZA9_9STRA|nr:unnamed protein product [Phytophthora fragariaefolia]
MLDLFSALEQISDLQLIRDSRCFNELITSGMLVLIGMLVLDGASFAPPGVRDAVDPVALGVARAELLEVGAVGVVAGEVANAPDADGGAHDSRGRDEHGLLELERQQAAHDAQHDGQHHEDHVRVLRVHLGAHGRVDGEGEHDAARRAGQEDAGAVEHEHHDASDEAAHGEGDPRGRGHPAHAGEGRLHDARHEEAAHHEGAAEDRGAEQPVARQAHDAAAQHGHGRQHGGADLDVLGGAQQLRHALQRARARAVREAAAGGAEGAQGAEAAAAHDGHSAELQQRHRQQVPEHERAGHRLRASSTEQERDWRQ